MEHNDSVTSKTETEQTAVVAAQETAQMSVWKGDFGRAYTDRNMLDSDGLDRLYHGNYGIGRRELNGAFLHDIAREAAFLEVGCNAGNQLMLLREMGYSNLSGVELQPYALEIARKRLSDASLTQGSALTLPHEDASFDVVFTSAVLIHIAPEDLPHAMDEIHRCTKSYIWGLEYYWPEVAEVNYRNHSGLLWKMDYARRYLDRFPDLELVREQRLAYLQDTNVDTMFLLRKKRQDGARMA
jgi:pseudaminic acid biosynthesis-associated methylase